MSVTNKNSEKGAALILVLGIVSVMSTMAIFSFDSLTRLISLTTGQNGQSQARQYAIAAETMAINIAEDVLKRDINLRRQAQEGQNRFVFSENGARISGEISDITNCFNLSSLVSGSFKNGWRGSEKAQAQFTGLLQNFGLGRQAANGISAAAVDWQDSDEKALPLGAETDVYTRLDPPYQQPNAPMTSVEELRLVRDVSPKLMDALGGLICADIVHRATNINVTMLQPEHAPLLQALLGPGVSVEGLRDMLEMQPQDGFTLEQFWGHDALMNADTPKGTRNMFVSQPRRIRIKINVASDTGRAQMKTDIHFYPNGAYAIIAREFGAL